MQTKTISYPREASNELFHSVCLLHKAFHSKLKQTKADQATLDVSSEQRTKNIFFYLTTRYTIYQYAFFLLKIFNKKNHVLMRI